MNPVIGMDVRIDENGQLQPWRVVLATVERPEEYREYLMRLPSGIRYLTPPAHPVHGDLTALPAEPEQQFRTLARDVIQMNQRQAYVASAHLGATAARLLACLGIRTISVDVAMPHDDTLDDPCGIGGEAGHEITHIIQLIRNSQ